MTLNTIKEKSKGELNKLYNELKDELFRLQLKKASNQLEKTHRFKEIKKEIARILTVQRAGELSRS